MEPAITTVIPTYRRPRLLARAVRSVLKQSYPYFQAHVYDNASGDETQQVVAELARSDARVKYHCHSQNVGLVRNLCFGLERVQTPLFNILSDDDIVLPEFFASAVQQMSKYPEVAMYMGATIDATTYGAIVDVPVYRYKRGLLRPPHGLLEIVKKRHSNWTGLMMSWNMFDLAGGLNVDIGDICDVDLQLRMSAQYPVFVSPSPAAVFFSHPAQASNRSRDCIRDQVFLPWKRIVEKLIALNTLS